VEVMDGCGSFCQARCGTEAASAAAATDAVWVSVSM
jgi:hypothetical protein